MGNPLNILLVHVYILISLQICLLIIINILFVSVIFKWHKLFPLDFKSNILASSIYVNKYIKI